MIQHELNSKKPCVYMCTVSLHVECCTVEPDILIVGLIVRIFSQVSEPTVHIDLLYASQINRAVSLFYSSPWNLEILAFSLV